MTIRVFVCVSDASAFLRGKVQQISSDNTDCGRDADDEDRMQLDLKSQKCHYRKQKVGLNSSIGSRNNNHIGTKLSGETYFYIVIYCISYFSSVLQFAK